MKFSSFFSLAFISLAAASPVALQAEKRLDLTPITNLLDSELSGTVNGVSDVVNSTTSSVNTIVKDVEHLLSTLISDVEDIASAAGLDVSEVLDSAGVTTVTKRSVPVAPLQRDMNLVIVAVTRLVTHLLSNLVSLAGDAGISLVGQLFSILNA